MEQPRPYHRLFALSWMDYFRGHPVTVEMEKDLSLKKQLLDVLLIRKEAERLDCQLPDGFEDLARFNLVSFKSHQDKLSVWALQELVGHYVNLRKQESPSMNEDDLLDEAEFRIYAVCARFPQQMTETKRIVLEPVQEGVYDVFGLGCRIRVVVVNQLAKREQNAMLHLFSAKGELLAYGAEHHRIRSVETSTLLLELFRRYEQEKDAMPDVLEDFVRETIDRLLKELPPEELRNRLSPEQRLEGLSAEKRLEGLSAEKRLEGLSVEERVQGLSAETLEALARQLRGGDASPGST